MVDFTNAILQASARTNLPPSVIAGVIQTESAGNPFALGGAGEVGLMQLSPTVGAGINRFDPLANIAAGSSYLASLVQRYGSLGAGLSAYNSGSPSSPAGQAYAARVLAAAAGNSQLDATLPAATAALLNVEEQAQQASNIATGNATGKPSIIGTLPSSIFSLNPQQTAEAAKAAVPNFVVFLIGAALTYFGFRSFFS